MSESTLSISGYADTHTQSAEDYIGVQGSHDLDAFYLTPAASTVQPAGNFSVPTVESVVLDVLIVLTIACFVALLLGVVNTLRTSPGGEKDQRVYHKADSNDYEYEEEDA